MFSQEDVDESREKHRKEIVDAGYDCRMIYTRILQQTIEFSVPSARSGATNHAHLALAVASMTVWIVKTLLAK
jgi:hypothetical protein